MQIGVESGGKLHEAIDKRQVSSQQNPQVGIDQQINLELQDRVGNRVDAQGGATPKNHMAEKLSPDVISRRDLISDRLIELGPPDENIVGRCDSRLEPLI